MTDRIIPRTAILSRRRGRAAAVPLFVLLLIAAALIASRPKRHPIAATDPIFDVAAYAGTGACVGCHKQESRTFGETGHARALILGTADSVVERLGGRASPEPDPDQPELPRSKFRERDGRIWVETDRAGIDPVPIDWCFGSGEFGMTFVTMLADSLDRSRLLEHHWSWFQDGDVLALTPGHELHSDSADFARYGDIAETTSTRQCFACHTTAFRYNSGRLDPTSVIAGVQCERCHGPRKQHVAAKLQSTTKIAAEPAKRRSAREQVFACGECHRRPEEINDEIRPDNPIIARFPSVGLLQSKCFAASESEGRLTCLTCHDPHRADRPTSAEYDARCTECHSRSFRPTDVLCSANPAGRSCIGCHMPKVRLHEHLEFTDHWIRRRNG